MPTPDKPKTKTQRFKEFGEAAVQELLRLAIEHDYPLSRPNWTALKEEISRQLTPHYNSAEQQVMLATAAKTGIDLEALKQRVNPWRAEQDLLTYEEVMERFGLHFAEIQAAQDLDFLQFVPVPDHVRQVPEKYLGDHHWRNYSRVQVDALSKEHLAAMASKATVMRYAAAEFLGIRSRDMDGLEQYIQPCDTVKTPRSFGSPLYSLNDLRRLKEQLAGSYLFLGMQREKQTADELEGNRW